MKIIKKKKKQVANSNIPLFGGGMINFSDEEIEELLLDFGPKKSDNKSEKKCECGAEKTYGKDTAFHSEWCPRYES